MGTLDNKTLLGDVRRMIFGWVLDRILLGDLLGFLSRLLGYVNLGSYLLDVVDLGDFLLGDLLWVGLFGAVIQTCDRVKS